MRRDNRACLWCISIHALLAESDPRSPTCAAFTLKFLSTLSLRRATYRRSGLTDVQHNFYPRSPCGERPAVSWLCLASSSISIHALLAESDFAEADCSNRSYISIHALLAESDYFFAPAAQFRWDFYPRSPCGERLRARAAEGQSPEFLSTLSLRRAT